MHFGTANWPLLLADFRSVLFPLPHLLVLSNIFFSCKRSRTNDSGNIDYFIESATYGFLFTSCKTLENERVSFPKSCNSWIKIRTKHFLWSNLYISLLNRMGTGSFAWLWLSDRATGSVSSRNLLQSHQGSITSYETAIRVSIYIGEVANYLILRRFFSQPFSRSGADSIPISLRLTWR